MPRLKSLDRHPPHDFQYLHPEIGQAEPFRGSFPHVCKEELKFRRANPFLCQKYGWKLDMAEIEKAVHDYNVHRCLQEGWTDFVTDGPAEYVPPQKKILRGAVAAVETTKAGIGLWMDQIGSSGVPVDAKIAEKRAEICVGCPHNKQGGLSNWFIQKVVDEFTQLFGIFKDLDVGTKHDEKLGVCELCRCALRHKVQVEMHHIQKHMTEEVQKKLTPVKHCWVIHGE